MTDPGRPNEPDIRQGAGEDREGRVARLIREGRLTPPTDALSADFFEDGQVADPMGRSLEALLDERREGR